MKTLKDFLNERQLGPMVVKNPDEQKFVDKHVVQKHDDRNGNGDDVFKAANVKKADRKKDRHGYEPGEDEAVYEGVAAYDGNKLVGNYPDMKTAKKMKPDHRYVVKLTKGWGDGGKSMKANYGKLTREEAEQIDELSADTLRRYSGRASDDAMELGKASRFHHRMGRGNIGAKHFNKGEKRLKGAALAYQKMQGKNVKVPARMEEVEQIDELSKKTLGSYIKKSTRSVVDHSVDATNADRQGEYDTADANYKKISNRIKGVNKAADKLSEKIDMDKASMGDVIKDFQDSDAPQFKGKSDKKRRAMAIAAKLTAERGSKGYTKEERLLARLEDVSESHKIELTSIFSKLSEENQNVFLKVCESEAGIEQMLDFAIQNRGK